MLLTRIWHNLLAEYEVLWKAANMLKKIASFFFNLLIDPDNLNVRKSMYTYLLDRYWFFKKSIEESRKKINVQKTVKKIRVILKKKVYKKKVQNNFCYCLFYILYNGIRLFIRFKADRESIYDLELFFSENHDIV